MLVAMIAIALGANFGKTREKRKWKPLIKIAMCATTTGKKYRP